MSEVSRDDVSYSLHSVVERKTFSIASNCLFVYNSNGNDNSTSKQPAGCK